MMKDEKRTKVVQIAAEIAALELRLQLKREELDALLAPVQKAQPRKPRPTADVTTSVSARVLEYLKGKKLGRSAVEVIEDLGLRDRREAVRSALKKHQAAGRLTNVSGVWTWIPEKEKAPVVTTEADLRRLATEEAARATITYPT